MQYINKNKIPTQMEVEAARYTLKHYREIFPTFEDIEDEVIQNDIIRCRQILAQVAILKQPIIEKSRSEELPWFMKGPKSEVFALQLKECLEQEAYGELQELRQEISKIKNPYAYKRYINIFNYVMKKSR